MAEAHAAIRVAAKTAIDAGDYRRAGALLDLLESKREWAPLVLANVDRRVAYLCGPQRAANPNAELPTIPGVRAFSPGICKPAAVVRLAS
jgi:hypothetical protein